MDLEPGFQELLQGLAPAMTSPSFASLCTIVSGWLFSGRGIVTRMIVAAGSGATEHVSSYHRIFSSASWSLDAMGLAVFTMLEPFLGAVVMLGLDDTLARKRGLRMFGTGIHHDPMALSSTVARAEVASRARLPACSPCRIGRCGSSPGKAIGSGSRPFTAGIPGKADPSFSDMLQTLRRTSVRQHVLAMAPTGRGSRKLAQLLEHAVAMAV